MNLNKTGELKKSFLGIMKPPSVYIIIVNWNGFVDTIECISSLKNNSYPNYTVVIVDNGSDKEEIDEVKKINPEVIVIKSNSNLGFSGGNNLGINHAIKAGADYVLLLNNDTIVEPDFLDELINAIIADPSIGITVPKINYFSDPQKIWYGGGYLSKIRASGFTIGMGETDFQHTENKDVTFATGCCLLIHSEVIKQIGLMDENYFLYLEDADYCYRTLLAGFKIKYIANSKIYHKVSVSTTKKNKLLPHYYVTRNRLYFIKKFHKYRLPIVFAIIVLIFLFKSLFWILSGEWKKIKIVYESIKDFLLNKTGQRINL